MNLTFRDILVILTSLTISLAVVVPFYGVLVRLRANFNPKALQLDSEGGARTHTGPVVKSLVGMAKRVWRLEGWPGLYKGLMPTAISTLIFTFFLLTFYTVPQPHRGGYSAPKAGAFGTLAYSLFSMVLSLPVGIITTRSITTPHRLPYFSPMYSLRILLTPTERRRPWILYLTPGLLASRALHIAYIVLFLGSLRRILLGSSHTTTPAHQRPTLDDATTLGLSVYLTIVLLSTAILTPLEVIGTRLMIQRNHASSEYNSVAQEEEGDAEELVEYPGDEDVIGLRHEGDPYLGLTDCAMKIKEEEGWPALFRAWWLTALGSLGGALS